MQQTDVIKAFHSFSDSFEGETNIDNITRTIYATDASIYREMPLAVTYPATVDDVKKLIHFCSENKIGIIPRAAGTSLAGQVVGNGIVADMSRHFKKIVEINAGERWVKVQPGVIPDELNKILKPYGLLFGPETSTSNRCNLGGMLGNNGCGLHSLVYGSVRDQVLEVKALLSDGSEIVFMPVDKEELNRKMNLKNAEGDIYRKLNELFSDNENKKSIAADYPESTIPRRNTGYALDYILDCELYTSGSNKKLNLSGLIAGSEGTLVIVTEIKLSVVPLPPPVKALSCVHLLKRNDAFSANLIALKYSPQAVELMDDRILALAEKSPAQKKNRFFIEGSPGALLFIEFCAESAEEIKATAGKMENEMRAAGLGYAFPLVWGNDVPKVWNLRKAGLGILSNMKGDAKPVSLIEDCAVDVIKLGHFVEDIEEMLAGLGKESVYHAHIATGELHIRPILNIKNPDEAGLLRIIGENTARIVKKYHGSMSGEHGDGRLRGEFIPIIIGERNYQLNKEVKNIFDPENIFNPGKIVYTPPMDTSLRYIPGRKTPELETWYDFSSSDGVVRAAEKCNGSGDCRKSKIIGGTMCPTFMATEDEKMSTRARANILREAFNNDSSDPWASKEVMDLLDSCLACKGCKSECPSEVDMAKLKSEYLSHYNERHRPGLRTRLIANLPSIYRLFSPFSAIFNFVASTVLTASVIKKITGFAAGRSIPTISRTTMRSWLRKNLKNLNPANPVKEVYLFIDEFTNYNDTEIGIAVVKLLTSLNYKVLVIDHPESARTYISKGFLRKARKSIDHNISIFAPLLGSQKPLIGIEPSAILGFRDEFPELASDSLKNAAVTMSQYVFLFEEFITMEFKAGRIRSDLFTEKTGDVLVHVHCQQKAVSQAAVSIEALSIPSGYRVKEIPSGCCGMAGAFGYEKEHFDLSVKIGEMILFPEVRNADNETIISAPGTSCRHHIKDGTGRKALHPAEILFNALKKA
jgi:FAD/FMN-containing dehydrogenase/Fe-S oxidoreductase